MDAQQLVFLPQWPLKVDSVFWTASALVVAALVGEFFFRKLRWPRVIGYTLTGFVAGTVGRGVDFAQLDRELRVILDITLAILLFELGNRVSIRWLRANPWLIATSVAESFLTFAAVAGLLYWLGAAGPVALAVGAISMSTAPVVISRITAELNAEGQVTERLMLLTALNCVYAVLAANLILAWVQNQYASHWLLGLRHPVYLICGSLVMAAVLASVVGFMARRFDLKEENGTILMLGVLLLAVAVTRMLKFSPLLVPLLAGIIWRWRDPRPRVWPRHFGTAGGVMVVLLFFMTGMSLSWELMVAGGLAAVGVVLVRALAKLAGVLAFARPSGISWRQGTMLGLALCPLSGVAFALAVDFYAANRDLGAQLGPVMLSAIAILELAGALLVQWALHRTNETHTPVKSEPAKTTQATQPSQQT
jgi:Kef-type K+ transport system membrane component KefB